MSQKIKFPSVVWKSFLCYSFCERRRECWRINMLWMEREKRDFPEHIVHKVLGLRVVKDCWGIVSNQGEPVLYDGIQTPKIVDVIWYLSCLCILLSSTAILSPNISDLFLLCTMPFVQNPLLPGVFLSYSLLSVIYQRYIPAHQKDLLWPNNVK